jgi:hypothetical protein
MGNPFIIVVILITQVFISPESNALDWAVACFLDHPAAFCYGLALIDIRMAATVSLYLKNRDNDHDDYRNPRQKRQNVRRANRPYRT